MAYDTGKDIFENLTYCPDHQLALCSSDSFCVGLKKGARTFTEMFRFKADFHGKDSSLNVVRWSPRGLLIATGGDDGTLRLFRFLGGPTDCWKSYNPKSGPVMGCSFSQLQQLVLFNTQKKSFLYNFMTGQQLYCLEADPAYQLTCSLFSEDKPVLHHLLYHRKTGRSYIETRTLANKVVERSPFLVFNSACSAFAKGGFLAVSSCEGEVALLDLFSNQRTLFAKGHDEMIVKQVLIVDQGRGKGRLLSCSPDNFIQIRECSLQAGRQPRGFVMWLVFLTVSYLLCQLQFEERLALPPYT